MDERNAALIRASWKVVKLGTALAVLVAAFGLLRAVTGAELLPRLENGELIGIVCGLGLGVAFFATRALLLRRAPGRSGA